MKKAKSIPSDCLLVLKHGRTSEKRIGKVHKQRGIAAVEFTLLLPLMLLFIAAIGEFGNILIKYNTLSKAVQNGARIAVTDVYGTANPDDIALDTDITNAVIYGSTKPVVGSLPVLEGLKVEVTQEMDEDGNPADPFVTISVAYPYQPLMAPLLDNIISQNFVLTSSSVMRVSP